jgi:WD40 repeat protein
VTTVDTVRDPASLTLPFLGLDAFAQENAPFFFGREAERRVLISNLRASRLTLLYAQSGAGKSSLLRAGVAARLVQLAGPSPDRRRTTRDIPIVFSSWRDNPTEELIAAVQQTITAFLPQAVWTTSTETLPNVAFDAPRPVLDATLPYRRPAAPPRLTHARLSETLKAASKAADATLLVMLDQFEEYFLYRSKETQDGYFAKELAACINQPGLRANFLISIREDAYSGLGDLFKSRIDNVYGNYLHLENLGRECARQAIERPVASFNELHPHSVPVEIEPGLVDMVLDELGPSQFVLDGGGRGRVSGSNGDRRSGGEIAAPYLQLVMKRLWETEAAKGSRTLRRATLEELGGAQTIVRTHVDRALGDLPEEDREAAVDIFHHLVTPSGTKIALAAADLAEYTGRPAEKASALLERLAGSDTRLVRPVPPPPGQEGGTRYEILHDLLALPILDWGGRQRAVRLKHEKESAEREARVEKRRARMFRALAIGAAVLLVAVGALTYFVQNARKQAESRAMAARAVSMLSQDPEKSAGLALQALNASSTAEAQAALRDALPDLQLKATLTPAPPVRSAAFSADGTKILTAAADGRIRVFDAATGAQLAAFAGTGTLNSAAFSRDGTRIVTASDDGTARILDASSGKVTGVLTPPGNGYAVSSAAFSPDGTLIVTTYANGIARIWDARTGKPLHTLTAEQGFVLLDASFSPNGKFVVTTSASGRARIYNAHTGAQVQVLSDRYVLESAAFSPDSKYVVTADGGGTARIWSVSTGKQAAKLAAPTYKYGRSTVYTTAFGAAFSPDGKRVVTAGSDGVARTWDVATGQLIRKLGTPHTGSLQAAAYSPDGRSVVTASASGLVRVWNAATGRPVRLLAKAGGTSPLRSAVFSPDGKWAATGSQYGTVTIWQAPAAGSHTSQWTARNVISVPEGDAVNGMAWSPNGKLLVTANQSGNAYVWLVPSGLGWGEFSGGLGQPLNTVAFDPAHQNWVVTAGADGHARIFSISADTQVTSLRVPGGDVNGAVFSPDGRQIVTAGSDGYARVWDPVTRRQIGAKFGFGSPMSSIAFSADGTKIVTTGNDGYTNIWDATQSPPTFSTFIVEPGNSVPHDAAFSPDGSVVITAGSDGTAREWSSATGNQLLVLGTSSGLTSTVAFRGSDVITASSDGTAKIWDAEPVEQRGLLLSGSGLPVFTSNFSPANPRIVATANGNGTVSIWNTSPRPHVTHTLPVSDAVSAEFSADGKLLVTAGSTRVRIWRMNSLGRPAQVLNTTKCENRQNTAYPNLDSAVFSPDGRLVVTSEQDGTACVWKVGNRGLVHQFTEPQGASGGIAGGAGTGGSAMRWAAFSPNGKQVLTANADGTARIWNLGTGKQVRAVSEPTGESINAAWFSPDGKLLVTASDDGTARIWDAATGRLLHTLSGPGLTPVFNAAFSHNGQHLVTCSGSAAVLWNTAGQQLTEFQQGNSLADCEFSPNGSQVVTAGGDGNTRIFSTELAGGLAQIEQIAEQRLHMTPQAAATCPPMGAC